MHIFEPKDRMIAVIKMFMVQGYSKLYKLTVILKHHLHFYAILLYINFPNVVQEFLYIYIYVVCLKSSVNGTRKQTKHKIQTN
jgi:hypothetical protein